MKINNSFVFVLVLWLFLSVITALNAQTEDEIYFKNLVKHVDGSECKEQPPAATFTVYMNADSGRILTDLAPRWDSDAEPNINGMGAFGIELGNFLAPQFGVGDTVHMRFTCSAFGQQGTIEDVCTTIPWHRFPQTLYLESTNLPQRPTLLQLKKTEENGWRKLSWQGNAEDQFIIYRRSYGDTLPGGINRMQYYRVGETTQTLTFTDTTTAKDQKYGYLVYAVNSEGNISARSREVNEDPYIAPGLDLTIGYLARLPRLDYVWDSENPAIEGWPPPEEPVTWRAVIKNWGDTVLTDVSYRWYLDGQLINEGLVTMPARDTVSVDYDWPWTFERHRIKFVLDADNRVAEEEEENNSLYVYTDAISAGFYVEQSVYDYFRRYQKKLEVHSNCWEDWAQRHVRIWNQMFADARFELTPNGVLDRIRLDKITVVPDGALPLNGGLPTNNPNLDDRTVDLQWGFPKTLLDGSFYSDHTNANKNNPFYFEGSLLHELGHARYLIDVYGFNVHENGSGNTVAIKEEGELIVGTEWMPLYGDRVFSAPHKGLMNSDYTKVDAYSAKALNLIEGHRAIKGNYNAPGNIGVYLQDLPQHNRVKLKDQNGNILKNAAVELYRAERQEGVWYGKFYDDSADVSLNSDENGMILLGRCPFDEDGTIDHTYSLANGVLILRVQQQERIGYGFLDVTRVNMEYWRGHTDTADYEMEFNMRQPQPILTDGDPEKPQHFTMLPNYPNPFNPSTTIQFQLPDPGMVRLTVHDCGGKLIKTIFNGHLRAGKHAWKWKGLNEENKRVASGIYFAKVTKNNQIRVQRLLLLN